MDSAALESSPSAVAARRLVKPRAAPPIAVAAAAITCRRVGEFSRAFKSSLLLIIALLNCCVPQSKHESTAGEYLQENILAQLHSLPGSAHLRFEDGTKPDHSDQIGSFGA